MNTIFKCGSIQAISLYNCSALTPEQWSERDGVRRPITGIIDMTYGVLMNILYIPIIAVMFEKDHFKMSCYKIMIFLAIVDMFALWVNSIITGLLAFQGAVYCTYPNLIYMAGLSGLGLWCCLCVTAMCLAINRLLDLTNPILQSIFFDGNRTYLVISFSIIYGLYFVLFTTPPIFTSKYQAWFTDPLIFENQTQEAVTVYQHLAQHQQHPCRQCDLPPLRLFLLRYWEKDEQLASTVSQPRKMSIQIFLQAAIICAINQIASIVYVVMNFLEMPFWLIIVGQATWQLGHGAPPLILISLNPTIRNGLLRKLKLKKTQIDILSTMFTETS